MQPVEIEKNKEEADDSKDSDSDKDVDNEENEEVKETLQKTTIYDPFTLLNIIFKLKSSNLACNPALSWG